MGTQAILTAITQVISNSPATWTVSGAGYIFICCILSLLALDALLTVVPNPPYGTVGSSVLLDIQGFPEEKVLSYVWFKSSSEGLDQIAVYIVPSRIQTPADISERVFSNGSLLIPNLTLSDRGYYVVQLVNFTSGEALMARGHLSVYDSLCKPTISSSNVAPVENEDNVTLMCQTSNQDVAFQWFSPSASSSGDRIKLSLDNRTLTVENVTKEDQGPYQCGIWNPVSHILSDPFTLNLAREDNGSSFLKWIIAVIATVIAIVVIVIVIIKKPQRLRTLKLKGLLP
ncbi:cell adhesion molecule CEACAM1-like [Macrotis lagotis]|uniref:cell adhesion molecule CEACAM1-like n=1 Tax=Macrotis lagotis TaxID=92651 RepID=UPI003D687D2E